MYFMIVFGMFVCVSLCISLCRLTVSKALDMSRATTTVLCGGFFLLKPCVMRLFMLCSAVFVLCLGLKPCCCGMFGMLSVMYGSMIFSSVFDMGDMSAIGLYEGPMFVFFPGFGMGIMLDNFQMCGIMLVLSAMLYVCVRYWIASGPKCLRCLMLMLSGPVLLLVLAACIADVVCSVVISMLSDLSLDVSLSVMRLFVCVACGTVFVNCLLNASALCCAVLAVLLLNVIDRLGCVGGFLCDSVLIVCHSLAVLCVWSKSLEM